MIKFSGRFKDFLDILAGMESREVAKWWNAWALWFAIHCAEFASWVLMDDPLLCASVATETMADNALDDVAYDRLPETGRTWFGTAKPATVSMWFYSGDFRQQTRLSCN